MSPDEDEKGPTRRPPCAVKAARTVTTGGMGRHSTAVRPVPTHWERFLFSGRLEIVGGWGRSRVSGRFLAHRYTVLPGGLLQ
jgi:hypothetical protein